MQEEKSDITITEREIDKFTIIVGNFKTFLSIIDRSSRKKISRDMDDWNNTIIKLI